MGNCVRVPARERSFSSTQKSLNNPGSTSSSSRRNQDNKSDKEKESINQKDNNNENNAVNSPNGKELVTVQRPKIFKFDDLNKATLGFKRDLFLGEGGFGEVYKGWINPKTYEPSTIAGAGMPVAVKKSKFPYSCQGINEWKAEVKLLAKFSHPNLVKLIGFCWEDNVFLVVYEYMPNGSLDKHLFNRSGEALLDWGTRLKIAIGAATGLAFLHSSQQSVIYRDFKTSNILLDEEYNAKISDFGLAKFGPVDGKSHVTTRIMGTHGYAAPEYVSTGHLYMKSDVYGFGVVLLEILTGRAAIEPLRAQEERELVNWAWAYLKDKNKLKRLMDPKLGNQYPIKDAWLAAELVRKCVQSERNNRPSMDEVLETLEKINAIRK